MVGIEHQGPATVASALVAGKSPAVSIRGSEESEAESFSHSWRFHMVGLMFDLFLTCIQIKVQKLLDDSVCQHVAS